MDFVKKKQSPRKTKIKKLAAAALLLAGFLFAAREDLAAFLAHRRAEEGTQSETEIQPQALSESEDGPHTQTGISTEFDTGTSGEFSGDTPLENPHAVFLFGQEIILPSYDVYAYDYVNDSIPFFSGEDRTSIRGQQFADLDELGRCGTCAALIGPETLPAGERGEIGMVRPSGWQVARYEEIDQHYLYNRCHLLAWVLTGQNDNEKNLITGTRALNVEGMEPFELKTLNYIRDTGNHVLYRVTPVFIGDELVARGVLMEGESFEDEGASLTFCVYCYNIQPGIEIDYQTGASWKSMREEQ